MRYRAAPAWLALILTLWLVGTAAAVPITGGATITSGTVRSFNNGGSVTIVIAIAGTPGFALGGSGNTGVSGSYTDARVGGIAPGSSFGLAFTILGDIGGPLTFGGVQYCRAGCPGGVSVTDIGTLGGFSFTSGLMTAPTEPGGHVDLNAPFSFLGEVRAAVPPDGLFLSLGGTGTVQARLTWSPGLHRWFLDESILEPTVWAFGATPEPVPAPATLLLWGTAAG